MMTIIVSTFLALSLSQVTYGLTPTPNPTAPLPKYIYHEGKHCGSPNSQFGENIEVWKNGVDAKYNHPMAGGLEACKEECYAHEECHGFVYIPSKKSCAWKRGPFKPFVYGDVKHDCYEKDMAIKANYGLCLDAAERKKAGGRVSMWTCHNGINQQWTYDSETGQIKSVDGYCLDASQRSTLKGKVHMWPCNTNNKNQMWTYTPSTGQIKATYGLCLDAKRTTLKGRVSMGTCDTTNKNQIWTISGAAQAARPPAQCNKPEVLERCKAWGRHSKEDNGCQAFANGWKKKSTNRCDNCGATERDYFACEMAECTALCTDMYWDNDVNRCINGCTRYKELLEAPKVYVNGIVGLNICPPRSSHIRNHEECKKAGDLLDGISTHRTPAGEWGHVPPYCSFQSRGDDSVHFNKRSSGKNNGSYTPICKRDPEGVDKDLRTAVPYTMDMINLSWRIYDSNDGYKRKAGDILTVSTTNNDWKIAQVVSSRDGTGRIWLAEYYHGQTCALVVRGTEFKQQKSVMQNLTFSKTKMHNSDYDIVSGYQDHVNNILLNDNNDEKIYAWLEKCSERGFKKMISGHSLGGAVATWLSIHLEPMQEKRRADYVVTFGAPRVVASYGSNRCPKSLQSRTRAVRIVTATTGIIGRWVDAAALLPPETNNDHNEGFCFESLSLDGYGNLLEQNNRWPNWSYDFTVNQLNGWNLHSSKSKYESYLVKAKEKIAANKKCYGKGTWCDDWGDFWGKGSCEKVCCFGAEWHITHHECKAEKAKVLPSGYWCDYFGIIRHSCGQCQKGFKYVWYKLRHECK